MRILADLFTCTRSRVEGEYLREQFLLPWTAVNTKHKALGVMAGYPEIDDVPAHASGKWMSEVLRQELGFRGIVMSEGGGFETLIL